MSIYTKYDNAKLLDHMYQPGQNAKISTLNYDQASKVCNMLGDGCTGFYTGKSKKRFYLTKGNKWKTKKNYTSWVKFPEKMIEKKSKKIEQSTINNNNNNSYLTKQSNLNLKNSKKQRALRRKLAKQRNNFDGHICPCGKKYMKSSVKAYKKHQDTCAICKEHHETKPNSAVNLNLQQELNNNENIVPITIDGKQYYKNSLGSVYNQDGIIIDPKVEPNIPPNVLSPREKEQGLSLSLDAIHENLSTINNLYREIDIKPKSFDLVVGNVQSGKTKVIISHAFKSLQIDSDMLVFIITRVSLADSLQMRDRISIFNKENIGNPRYFIYAEDINKIKIMDIPQKRVIVSLGNKARLQKCLDLINHPSIKKFCICIDEQDLVASDTTKAELVLSNILKHEKIHHILAVTATPLATYMSFKKKPHVNRIFKLDKPPNYVGLLEDGVPNPKLKFMEAAPVNRSRKSYDETTDLSNIDRMLTACDISRPFCISLILSAVRNDDQRDLIIKVVQRNPEWVGLVYNQNNVEIIGAKNIDPLGRVIKQTVVNDGPDPENPGTEVKGSLSIALTLLRNSGVKKIVMAAGKKADRGISFTDSAFKYHLTSIYIRQSEKITLHCESLIQKLRILGIYHDEFTPTMKDIPLLLWTTSKLYSNLKRCQLITDEYTDKLAATTNQGQIISTIKDMNGVFQEIIKIQEDIPDVPLSKKRYQELVDWKPYEEILNQASKIDGISYNRYTKGWHLGTMGSKSIRKPHFELCDNNCSYYEKQVDFIIKKLNERMPEKWTLDPLRRHQLTWYIPNVPKSDFIVDEGASGYKNEVLIDEFISDLDIQTISNQFQQMGKQGIKINNIFPKLKKNRQSYKGDSYDYIGNPYEQILRKEGSKKMEDGYYHYKKSPLRIRYDYPQAKSDEVSGTVPRENCPMVMDIRYPVSFKLGEKIIDSGINTGDIIWWHNLYGVVFVDRIHPESVNDYKEWADKSKVILQLTGTESPQIILPKPKPKILSSPIPGHSMTDLEMLRLWELHKHFKGMSSNDSHEYFSKYPEKLEEYHSLRNKKWPDSLLPAQRIIETLSPHVEKMRSYKIIDMGCGNAVIANKFTNLNIKSIDHISLNPKVSIANMKNTKEPTNHYDIVIFCLSLSWGGEEEDYLKEAERVCNSERGGLIWIIEPIKRKEKLEELISKFTNIMITETQTIKGNDESDKFIWFKLKLNTYIDF